MGIVCHLANGLKGLAAISLELDPRFLSWLLSGGAVSVSASGC